MCLEVRINVFVINRHLAKWIKYTFHRKLQQFYAYTHTKTSNSYRKWHDILNIRIYDTINYVRTKKLSLRHKFKMQSRKFELYISQILTIGLNDIESHKYSNDNRFSKIILRKKYFE